jgi:hypothetical protein
LGNPHAFLALQRNGVVATFTIERVVQGKKFRVVDLWVADRLYIETILRADFRSGSIVLKYSSFPKI